MNYRDVLIATALGIAVLTLSQSAIAHEDYYEKSRLDRKIHELQSNIDELKKEIQSITGNRSSFRVIGSGPSMKDLESMIKKLESKTLTMCQNISVASATRDLGIHLYCF